MAAKKTQRKKAPQKSKPECLSCKRLQNRITELETAAPNPDSVLNSHAVPILGLTDSAQIVERMNQLVYELQQASSRYWGLADTLEEEIEERVEEDLDHRAFLEEVAEDRRRLCRRAS